MILSKKLNVSSKFCQPHISAASGDVQAYQIRAAPASTIAPGVVMASSPALPTQGATEEVTRKREVRLMKNRYEQRKNLCHVNSFQAGVSVQVHDGNMSQSRV